MIAILAYRVDQSSANIEAALVVLVALLVVAAGALAVLAVVVSLLADTVTWGVGVADVKTADGTFGIVGVMLLIIGFVFQVVGA